MNEFRPKMERAVGLLASGGDARIHLDPATGLNRYHSAPRPRDIMAYASSTANDISPEAFDRVQALVAEMGEELSSHDYAERLERLRSRIRSAYEVDQDVAIVFAPSGTDLEYVALACVAGKGSSGTHNILLGADEVGSGCIHSAYGRYFAGTTALGSAVAPGMPVPGLGETHVELIDIPVRDEQGRARPSDEISAKMDEAIAGAKAAGRHALVHVVHGSKTGLIVPSLDDIDRLRAAHKISIVVDACQARITGSAIQDYLEREAIVFLTGSKFMGGPPFSGLALVPPALARRVPPLPSGFATIFRRAEWPAGWPGSEHLPAGANPGLLLRLEASIFELERFRKLPPDEASRVILAFHAAVRSALIEKLPVRRVAPYPPGNKMKADTHPIEMRTLSTLDLSALGGGASLEDAQAWHQALVGRGIRLGQPVKCVRLPDDSWGATLRIGLSMPLIVERAKLSDDALAASFQHDMAAIAEALAACAGSKP